MSTIKKHPIAKEYLYCYKLATDLSIKYFQAPSMTKEAYYSFGTAWANDVSAEGDLRDIVDNYVDGSSCLDHLALVMVPALRLCELLQSKLVQLFPPMDVILLLRDYSVKIGTSKPPPADEYEYIMGICNNG